MKPNGEIITFYSYKGGTGRSMALANVACLLAKRTDVKGSVLMIDWDLEAPGLHQFFRGRFENQEDKAENLPKGQLGLIDFFCEAKNLLAKSESGDVPKNIFEQLNVEKYVLKLVEPQMYFMPAGNFDDGLYSTRVNEFNWSDFFDKYPSFFPEFAQYLREIYKYVLIDSRTGYTDISGICTSIMPEKLVTVFTPNRQSVSGVVELIRRATDYRKQSDDLRSLMIFPLPSRIENAESKLQKEWRFGNLESGIQGYQEKLESVLVEVYGLQECDLTKYFDEYQLQYVPRYSYGEEISVVSERPEDRLSLARSFENFTERIVSSENPWEEIPNPLYEKRKAELSEVAKFESRRRLFVRATLGVFVVAVIVLGYLVFTNFQILSQLIYGQPVFVLVIVWVATDLLWVERWRSLISRIGKLVSKPIIFKKDDNPNEIPLYPRSVLEQLALNSGSANTLESNGAYSSWMNAQRNLVFNPVRPLRSLGYVISLLFFIFFLIADSIVVANTLSIMGLISPDLPAILKRMDIAIIGGAVFSVVIGMWMLIEMAGKGEFTNIDYMTEAQKRLLRAIAALVTLFSVMVMLALAIQRLISLGALQSSLTTDLIVSFILYGLLSINISLSAALTFQQAASGVIVLLYLLVFIFPVLAFLTDVYVRITYIIFDVVLWAILTPIISIPYWVSRTISSIGESN